MLQNQTCQSQFDQDDHRMSRKQFHFLLDLKINNHVLFLIVSCNQFYLQFYSNELQLLEFQEFQHRIIPMISEKNRIVSSILIFVNLNLHVMVLTIDLDKQ
jgi:hypothetical protein